MQRKKNVMKINTFAGVGKRKERKMQSSYFGGKFGLQSGRPQINSSSRLI